jgi:hypothetical protein
MEKRVGTIVSKVAGISYPVKWDSTAKTVWIGIKEDSNPTLPNVANGWLMVGGKAETEREALACAQEVVDSQPYLGGASKMA